MICVNNGVVHHIFFRPLFLKKSVCVCVCVCVCSKSDLADTYHKQLERAKTWHQTSVVAQVCTTSIPSSLYTLHSFSFLMWSVCTFNTFLAGCCANSNNTVDIVYPLALHCLSIGTACWPNLFTTSLKLYWATYQVLCLMPEQIFM